MRRSILCHHFDSSSPVQVLVRTVLAYFSRNAYVRTIPISRCWRGLLLACADESSDKTSDDGRTERHPTSVVVVSSVMMVAVVFGRWCGTVSWRVMPWCGSRSAAFSAARSCHRRGAERETCESENQKFFDCLVHSVPSLSFFVFCADFIAAYIMQGKLRRIF